MKFDVVLIERQASLTKQDITDILSVLPDGETFIPLNIDGDASSAMGFITYYAADCLDFLYGENDDFYTFIQEILNDVEKESLLCLYDYDTGVGDAPIRILLTRDLPAAVARLNQPAVGTYAYTNTSSILVHEIDPWGEWVIASINGAEMQVCEITQAEKDDPAPDDDVETGFYFGGMWVPFSEVMQI